MRYAVKKMPGGGRWYINDTVTNLDVCRRWPQEHILRTWATEAAARKMAAKWEREDGRDAFDVGALFAARNDLPVD